MKNLNAFHLNGLKAVEAVMRGGSLAAAAEELGVSTSAVSQQINRTELQLGRALFKRTRSGLVPTTFGARFGTRLASGFRELSLAVAMADDRAANTLVVSVAPAFASRWLVPRLSRFFAAYPDILLRIDASTKLIDLDHSDVDLAIRMGDGSWPGVDSSLLLAQEIFPVCSPGLAKSLHAVSDLENFSVISDSSTMFSWDSWFESAGVAPVAFQPGATFTDPILCLEAVIAGQGVMLAWQLLAADALADGRLVAPFGSRARSGLGYYMVTAKTRTEPRKVAVFRRWVQDEIAATLAAA